MFEHYLPNKNERATVAPKSKFTQLNQGSLSRPPWVEDMLSRVFWALLQNEEDNSKVVSAGREREEKFRQA